MNTSWLVEIFEGAGLEPDDARRAAEATWKQLVSRGRAPKGKVSKSALRSPTARDPLSSVDRILGRTGRSLPFLDEETETLSVTALTRVLSEVGIDWVVALAYAKVVAEAYEPTEFYGPIWNALGKKSAFDLDALREADWTPLRGPTKPKAVAGKPSAVPPKVAPQAPPRPRKKS